jgi:hypothetical protein
MYHLIQKEMALLHKHTGNGVNEGRCPKSLFNNMFPGKVVFFSLPVPMHIQTHTNTFLEV